MSGDFLRDYELDMQRRGLTKRSVVQLVGQVRSFDRWLAERGRDLSTATTDDVQRFLDFRDIKAKTRYGWVSGIHGAYAFGLRTGQLDHDPTVKIIRPKLRRGLPRPLTDAELALALEQASPVMRAWVALASFGGLRVMEIAGLTVEALHFDAGRIRVFGKGEKERLVPLHPLIEETLKAAGLPRRGHVFLRPQGGPYTAKQISREGSLYFQSLGIAGGLHRGRHWFATRTLEACGNLRTVQELLGHSSPQTTARYAAFSQKDAAQAVASLHLSTAGGLTPDATNAPDR